MNFYFVIKAKVWIGPTSKIWERTTCNGLSLDSHTLNYEQCKQACEGIESCNAFGHHITSDAGCEVYACPLPIPTPDRDSSPHWQGYYLMEGI